MPTITGSLATFGTTQLAALSPELWFIPSTGGYTASDGKLRVSKPVKAVVAPDQTFSVYLVHTTAVRSATPMYYTIEVRWLDTAGNYISIEHFPGLSFRVTSVDAVITDLIDAPILSDHVWISPGGAEPQGSVSGDLIFDPTTNDLLRIN